MEKSQKIILTGIIILIVMMIVIFVICIKLNQEKEISEQYYPIDEILEENTVEPVKTRNNFYIVKDCINKYYTYYMTVFNMEETYGNIEETMLQSAKQQNAEAIYNMLDSEYIKAKSITKDNILTKLSQINPATVYITNMYVTGQTGNITVYIAKGILKENKSENTSQFLIMIKVDAHNETFSILPQDYVEEKYSNIKVGDSIKIEVSENIAKNVNNIYTFKYVSDETYVRDLFSQYKLEVLNTISLAYEKLNEEYKNARFDSLEKFKEYINNNQTKYSTMQIEKYQKTVTDDYTQYVCIDQNENYYIFRETSVMDYSVILDTYTIDLPEFIEKYEAANEETKIAYNIEKIKEAISENNYKYVYNKLDETYKQNNFPTYNKFEEYLKSNLSKFNYEGVEPYGNVYVATIGISDSKKMKIIMQLSTGTDFYISFNFGE